MIEIKGKLEGNLDIKRFYLDGLDIDIICPKCKNKYKFNDYLSFPQINKKTEINLWCEKCDNEWEENIIININIIKINNT